MARVKPIRAMYGSLMLACLLSLLTPLLARGDSETQRLLDGLRTRRLFSLAESFARQQLLDDRLSSEDRAELVIELVRTYAAHAVNSAPQDRERLWQQARDVASEFQRNYGSAPRLILIRVQDAITVFVRGELARQEVEVGGGQIAALNSARQQIREAVGLLEQLDGELTQEIPLRRRRVVLEGELSADELATLQVNIRYQLARAYRNQALCYEIDSTDRVAALTQAVEQLRGALTQLPADDPLVWPIRIEQVVCYRLLEDFDKAASLLGALQNESAPPAIQLTARAEAARIELATGQPAKALQLLAQGRTIGNAVSADLDFAILETYEASWRAAEEQNQQAEASEWQKKALAMASRIEDTHGAYWGRRANLLLVHSAQQGAGVQDVEILMRIADNLYAQGQLDEAVTAYDHAAQTVGNSSDQQQAFSLAYKAALILQNRGQYREASQRLRILSMDQRLHPQAADAHLLACWNVSRLVAQEPAMSEQYVAVLNEQAEIWPTAPSTDKTRIWLGRFREHEKAWHEAIVAYLSVSPRAAEFEAAAEAAGRCSYQWMEELKAAGQPLDSQADRVAAYFEDVIMGADRRLPAQWNSVARYAALTAARLRLQYQSNAHAHVTSMLQAAIDGSPDAPETWKATARSLQVVALAGQTAYRDKAQETLRQIAGGEPAEMLKMLVNLAALGRSAPSRANADLASLQLEAVELLWPKKEQLPRSSQLTLECIRARALADVGKRAEAHELFEILARDNPNDGQIQESYAEFLLDGRDQSTLKKALDQWRLVASKSRPRSDAWYQAKYSLALAEFKLGNKQRSAQLIRYLQFTPPGLEATERKSQFLALLKLCEQ